MDYKNLVQRCCDFYERCIGIPYDFDGTLSLEAKFIKLFKTCQEMFAQNAELAKAFGDLSQKVDDFISDVGVQGMVERIIQGMADDGSLADIIGEDLLAPVNAKLENHEQRIKSLETEVGTLSGLPARMTAVEQKATQASTDATSAKEMAQQAKDAVDAIPPDIGSVGEQLTEFESRIEAVETSNSQTVKTVQSYDVRITQAASTAGNAQRDATAAQDAASEAQETANGVAADVALAKSDAAAAKSDAATAKSDAASAKSQSTTNARAIGELQTQVAQNTSDIAELKSGGGGGGGGSDTELEQRVNTLETEVSTLETNYTSLSQKVSGFSENINQAMTDASTAKSEASQAQSDVTALESTVTGIQSDVSENTSDISQNTRDITSLKSRVSALEEGGTSAEDIHGWWSNKTWLFIGDSWMEGFNDDVSGSSGNLTKGWGAQAAYYMGFLSSQLNNNNGFYVSAKGGTGFAAQSNGFRTLLTEWCDKHTSILDKVDFVVVGGGYNDAFYPESQINTGIQNFYQVVSTRLPNATMVIVPIAWANYGASNAYSNLYSTSQLGGMLNAYLNFGDNSSARGKTVAVCDTLWAIGRCAGIYDSRGMHPTYNGNSIIGHAFAQWVKGGSGYDLVFPSKNPETPKIVFNSTWSTSEIALQARVVGDQLHVGVPYNGECILKCASQEMYMYYDSEFQFGNIKSCAVNGRTQGIYWVVPATAKSAGDDGGSFFDIHVQISIRAGKMYCKPICMNDARTDYLRLQHLTEITMYLKLPFQTVPLFSQ